MKMIDVHAHLTDERFLDVDEVLIRARESGVENVITSAYDLTSSKKSIELSNSFNGVFATVGIHPENLDGFEDTMLSEIEVLGKHPKVVAIGEIGLDYHYAADTKELQKEVFVKQIEIANKLNKPVVIHSRDAMGDTIEILKHNQLNRESLLHCYGGSVESAKILMEMGFAFSFGGVVTFKNAKTVVDVVKFLPIEKILLETDCPYLSPEPFRGKRNEPKNVVYVADVIAKIKGLTMEKVAEITTQNAKRIFKYERI